jgi:hypothetical protein
MTAYSIAPGGGGRDSMDSYADYARAQKARGITDANTAAVNRANSEPEGEAAGKVETLAWGKDGFTFGDVLDIINPLQHIPVVSDIYRALTGDEIAPAARLMGGGLLGGVPGLAVAAVNTAVQEVAGQDLGEMAIASLFGDQDTGLGEVAETAIASAAPIAPAAEPARTKPVALQFASAQPPTTQPATTQPAVALGAAAGSSAPEPAASGGINFFNMNARPAPAAAHAASPGAIQNSMFTPLAGMPDSVVAAQAAQQAAQQAALAKPVTSAAKAPTASPAPAPMVTNLALANQTVEPKPGAIKSRQVQPAPQPGNPVFADNGLTPEQQQKANRAALLAAARDLRKAFQSHSAYKTDERVKTLQDGQ